MFRILFILMFLVSACGGKAGESAKDQGEAGEPRGYIDADSMTPRAVLVRADLATEVDEQRYRPLLPPTNNFQVDQDIIYLVGKLKKVPANANIEVRWYIDASPDPLLVSSVIGSDRYQFLASFRPVDQKFIRGSYSARIYVNDREVGAVPFLIHDANDEGTSPQVQNISFSTKIRQGEQPIKPQSQFPKGTEQIFATFTLKGADFNDVIQVSWFHGTELFHTENVSCTGDKRYATYISSSPFLPVGEYRIEVTLAQGVVASKGFLIGKRTSGPTVDEIRLGRTAGDDNMPQEALKRFKRKDESIFCGLSFIDLEPETMLQIEWANIDGREPSVLATQKTIIASGGTGTFGINWEPDEPLVKGKYRITVLINGEPGAEQEFEVR